jgi:hypothetical protein
VCFCDAGYKCVYSNDLTVLGNCIPCAAGKYSLNPGVVECTLCEAGKYKTLEGPDACTACVAGKYSSTFLEATSVDVCIGECAAGKYSDVTGASSSIVCKDCEAGKSQHRRGQSSCWTCPAVLLVRALTEMISVFAWRVGVC